MSAKKIIKMALIIFLVQISGCQWRNDCHCGLMWRNDCIVYQSVTPISRYLLLLNFSASPDSRSIFSSRSTEYFCDKMTTFVTKWLHCVPKCDTIIQICPFIKLFQESKFEVRFGLGSFWNIISCHLLSSFVISWHLLSSLSSLVHPYNVWCIFDHFKFFWVLRSCYLIPYRILF